MIEVVKKERESTQSLIKRFTRKIRQSKVLFDARSKRFKNRPLSKLQKKQEALKKAKKAKHFEYLQKLGKIK